MFQLFSKSPCEDDFFKIDSKLKENRAEFEDKFELRFLFLKKNKGISFVKLTPLLKNE